MTVSVPNISNHVYLDEVVGFESQWDKFEPFPDDELEFFIVKSSVPHSYRKLEKHTLPFRLKRIVGGRGESRSHRPHPLHPLETSTPKV